MFLNYYRIVQIQLSNIAIRQLLDKEGFEEDESLADRVGSSKGKTRKKKKVGLPV